MKQLVGMPKTKKIKKPNKNHPTIVAPDWFLLFNQFGVSIVDRVSAGNLKELEQKKFSWASKLKVPKPTLFEIMDLYFLTENQSFHFAIYQYFLFQFFRSQATDIDIN